HYDIGGQEACRCNQNQRATVTLLTGAMCIVAQPLIVWAVQSPAQRSPADQQHRNGDGGDIVSHNARVQQECTIRPMGVQVSRGRFHSRTRRARNRRTIPTTQAKTRYTIVVAEEKGRPRIHRALPRVPAGPNPKEFPVSNISRRVNKYSWNILGQSRICEAKISTPAIAVMPDGNHWRLSTRTGNASSARNGSLKTEAASTAM